MKSGMSFFNKALLKKNLLRFWPLWASYTLIWIYALPLNCLLIQQQDLNREDTLERMTRFALRIPDRLEELGILMAVGFGILTAMAMFSYLFNNRSACMVHGLPTRREGLFLTGYLSGLICLLGLKIKEVVPLKIPAFAWASLLGTVLAFPFWPWHAWFLNVTGGVGAGVAGTVILALTGISIGTKLADLKKISWRIAIVSIFVFCGTFFGSAIVAQIIMKVQGII